VVPGRGAALRAASATAALRADVASLSPETVAARSSQLVHAVRRLARRHRLLHVLGNTWVRFGAADVLAEHLRDAVKQYGRTYAEFAAAGTESERRSAARVWSRPHSRWENGSAVTEAQLRLSLFAINATLVDLPMPFAVSGGYPRLLQRKRSDPPVFLLRKHHVVRVNACTCPHYY
jgi:hypothetical protein